MLIGMGIVYLFLALLVWIIGITHRLIRDSAAEEIEPVPARAATADETGTVTDAELVAVIAAALRRYH